MIIKSIAPPALKPGDTIGVMAPSSHVEKDDIEKSKTLLESRGYKVFIHPQTYERDRQSAGTHLQKTLALQGLWQRDDIKAIWAAGGGNRALHLLNAANFEKMKAKPKIFVGFSDITALLNAFYAHNGLISFHGPVFKNLHRYNQLDHALGVLKGEEKTYDFSEAQTFRSGKSEGALVGGNLSIFQYLPQTLPGESYKNAILFLEDCNEELSKIDRMFLHLKRLGVLNEVNGLILGEFTDMKESGRPFGFTLEDIVTEHMEGMDIPILMNAPFGHGNKLYTLPLGARVAFDAASKTLTFKSDAVQL